MEERNGGRELGVCSTIKLIVDSARRVDGDENVDDSGQDAAARTELARERQIGGINSFISDQEHNNTVELSRPSGTRATGNDRTRAEREREKTTRKPRGL